MSLDTAIQALSLIATVITAGAASYLAYNALVFTARPRIVLTTEPARPVLRPNEEAVVNIWLENRGHWYAQPAATKMLAYVNVDEECEPLQARLGLTFEDDDYHTPKDVATGKGRKKGRRSRYLVVNGINIVHDENGEVIELRMRAPKHVGTYEGWLVLIASEGDCGLHVFEFDVKE